MVAAPATLAATLLILVESASSASTAGPNIVGCPATAATAGEDGGTNDVVVVDVLIYGGTAGGVVAGVAAARATHQGHALKVLLLNPSSSHLGGMVSSGLGKTDGKDSGGIAREFFKAVGGYSFAPSAAERVFDELARNASLLVASKCRIVAVMKHQRRAGSGSATVMAAGAAPSNIVSVTTSNGGTIGARVFIDATYEGDLMQLAGVNYTVGREASCQYDEEAAGRLPVGIPGPWSCGCNWNLGIVDGRGADGKLLPMVRDATTMAAKGAADKAVQAYNFRLCLTQDATNFRSIPAPARYDPIEWQLLRRVMQHLHGQALQDKEDDHTLTFSSFIGCVDVGGNKTDCNNHGGLSTDFIGASWTWPDANHQERLRLFELHKTIRWVSSTSFDMILRPHLVKPCTSTPSEDGAQQHVWGVRFSN